MSIADTAERCSALIICLNLPNNEAEEMLTLKERKLVWYSMI